MKLRTDICTAHLGSEKQQTCLATHMESQRDSHDMTVKHKCYLEVFVASSDLLASYCQVLIFYNTAACKNASSLVRSLTA